MKEQQEWEERVILICKPEQSGKTFVMIQQIIKDLEESTEGKTVINMIFCDNSLLLTKQTSTRVQRDLKNHENEVCGEVDGEIICNTTRQSGSEEEKNFYMEFSTGKGAKRNRAAVWYAITADQIRNVICCTNKTRVSDIS